MVFPFDKSALPKVCALEKLYLPTPSLIDGAAVFGAWIICQFTLEIVREAGEFG